MEQYLPILAMVVLVLLFVTLIFGSVRTRGETQEAGETNAEEKTLQTARSQEQDAQS